MSTRKCDTGKIFLSHHSVQLLLLCHPLSFRPPAVPTLFIKTHSVYLTQSAAQRAISYSNYLTNTHISLDVSRSCLAQFTQLISIPFKSRNLSHSIHVTQLLLHNSPNSTRQTHHSVPSLHSLTQTYRVLLWLWLRAEGNRLRSLEEVKR